VLLLTGSSSRAGRSAHEREAARMNSRTPDAMGDPRTVDEARHAVERSRERISSTLDQLEDRIVEKKHELQDRVDVLRPVREQIVDRPFTAIAVAVGIGALLGSLGGSDSEFDADDDVDDDRTRDDVDIDVDEDRHYRRGLRRGRGRHAAGYLEDDERAELRAWRRARRDRLRARLDSDNDDESESRFGDLRHQLVGAVTSAIGTAVSARIRDFAANAGNSRTGRREGRSSRYD
jgi:ElaB/YqjD/DUF883 family membrane-anchored ribosome-binding protein